MSRQSTTVSQSRAGTSTTPQHSPGAPPKRDMVWIEGGSFQMGSDDAYPEEAPSHRVEVGGFWIDRYPVTNERFARFVEAVHYVTFAEVASIAIDSPWGGPRKGTGGSLVFVKPTIRGSRHDTTWWRHVVGANWRHPRGPDSSNAELEAHPVVHVTYGDALAFAEWEGLQLPTEAEWEFAARGGLEGTTYAWGDQIMPDGRPMANYWQGPFPYENALVDGWEYTSPVGNFPANGYGLYDMIGNVWEWTADWFRALRVPEAAEGHHPATRRERRLARLLGAGASPTSLSSKVLKGGSHLCDVNHCHRYRPSARWSAGIRTSTSDIGFRCILRP